MYKFWNQFLKDFTIFFKTPFGFIIIFFHLLILGFNFYYCINSLNMIESRVTLLESFFNSILFWFPVLSFIPIITMRSFSDENKSGTLEILLTTPLSDIQIVLSKFIANLLFYFFLWFPSIIYFLVFWIITKINPANSIESIIGTYLILFFLSSSFISIGLFTSILTKNQLLAAVYSFSIIFIFFIIGMLTYIFPMNSFLLKQIISYFSLIEHISRFASGYIDTRPIFLFFSITSLFIYFCLYSLTKKRENNF